MELFLDGVPVGSTAKSGAIDQNPSIPVWIGANPTEASDKPWKGRIDDVRVYDRALSMTELAALPPPSDRAIFADGFETGDVSAWSPVSVGSLEVLSAAARVGSRGLRAKAGTSCPPPDDLSVFHGPVSGTFEACRTLWVAGVEVVAPGATFRAGERIALGDGLVVASDLALEIDPLLTPFAWVRDESPAAESVYTAEFDMSLDGVALGSDDRIDLLVAMSGTDTFRLVVRSDGADGHEVLLEARRDDGSYAVTPPGQEVILTAGWHRLRLDWRAGAGSGSLAVTVDGSSTGQLTGLANAAQRVDRIEWGVVGGVLDTASGVIDIDAFRSWR
jgi:hypothetical protein